MAKLITTIEEVRAQLPVNYTADFDRLKPYLDNSERLYILKVIGKLEFNEIVTIYVAANNNVGNIVDENVAAAVTAAQKVIANIGFLMATPMLSLSIGAAGIQIHSNAEKKQAFQWQVEDLKTSLQEIGFTGIEELLDVFNDNPTTFASYFASDEYLANTKYLITSAAEFNSYFEIKSSRFLFHTLGSLMARVEAHELERIFGETFMARLKAADATDALKSLANKYLKPALALLTAARAINERIISFNQGIASFNFISSNSENIKVSKELTDNQIAPVTESLKADADQYLQDAKAYVLANPTDFPDYVEPEVKRRFKANNRKDAGIYIP